METSKKQPTMDKRRAVFRRYLREWPHRYGRTAHLYMVRGAAYGIGSGAVSVLVVWVQSR